MNQETATTALSLLERGEVFAWVTVVDTRGSTPRHAGATMLVTSDGSTTGTIGGGPLEAAAIRYAYEALNSGSPGLIPFESVELGMTCGGGGHVLIDRIDPTDEATRELFRGFSDLLGSGRTGWLVTVVHEESTGTLEVGKCLVDSNGSVTGDPIASPTVLRELARRGGTYDHILADDPARTYVQPVGMRGTAYVFGAGHCGQKLVPLLTSVGFFTVVIDDRADFASRERFPSADQIIVPESFDSVMDNLSVEEGSYIVIVTRGHLQDTNVLGQSLRTRAGYIGMIGSRDKVAEACRVLRREGFSSEDIARVHAPIGLAIGGETPEEIAVSIAAQLIQVRASKGK